MYRFLLKLFIPLICIVLATCVKQPCSIGILVNSEFKTSWDIKKQYFKKNNVSDIPIYIEYFDNKNIENCLNKLIADNVNVIIIHSKNNQELINVIKKAHNKKIKIISYEYLIKKCDVDMHISFDEEKIGFSQTKYLINQKPKGNYAIIGGPKDDENSILISLGQKDAISSYIKNGDIKIVYQTNVHNNIQSEGYIHMMKIFANTENIDVVITSDDDITEGVIKAIDEKKYKHKILVAGQGISAETCFRIMEGQQTLSVYKPIDILSQITYKAAYELSAHNKMINYNTLLNNESSKLIPTILIPTIIINKNTINTTVIQPVK